MNPTVGQVVIGPEFFQKEIQNYTRWEFAWGREVGQNSLDAGAKNIVIKVLTSPEPDSCRVVWADDGAGMTLDILLNKFLTLGASHKRKGATGGFGWAKTLILFAQSSYIIRTNDILLEGCGGSFEYTEGHSQVDGCIIDVTIPTWSSIIKRHIKSWAQWTDFNGCSISLDGKPLVTFGYANVKGEKPLPIDWATMKVVECPDNCDPSMFFRINGQMMGVMSLPGTIKDYIVIDVVGDSTHYLTANRDQLIHEKRCELRAFIEELYRDPRAAVKLDTPTSVMLVGSKGMLPVGVTDEDRAARVQQIMDNPELLESILKARTETSAQAVHDGFTMMVNNDTNKTIPTKWMPGMWNKHAIKLMTRWTSIILLVGDIIGYKGDIMPGWVFSTDSIATWTKKTKTMSLNPVFIDAETGKMTNRYKFDNFGFIKMVTCCIHEYVHAMGYDYHDTDFLEVYEACTEAVMNNWSRIVKLRRKV
jgi:hypothetical protein